MNSENLNYWGLLSSLLNCYPSQPFAMENAQQHHKNRVTRPKTSQHHPVLVLPGHLEKKNMFFSPKFHPFPPQGLAEQIWWKNTPDPSAKLLFILSHLGLFLFGGSFESHEFASTTWFLLPFSVKGNLFHINWNRLPLAMEIHLFQ